jgi:hypothetical protein
MTFIEFLGFIITITAMIAIVVKKNWEERDRRKNPEKYRQKEEQLRKLLKSLETSEEDEEEEEEDWEEPVVYAPPPKIPNLKKATPPKKLSQPLSSFSHTFPNESDAYAIKSRIETCRGKTILQNLHSKKDFMVLQAILNKPKSLE